MPQTRPTERTPHDHAHVPHHRPAERPAEKGGRLSWTLQDILTVSWRNLRVLTRNPDAVFFSAMQPIMFVLLFVYVFGGAIQMPGVPYVDYLMPGVYVQTVTFGGREHGGGAVRGPPEGPDRALPRPAHGPLGRAGRAHHGRPGAQRVHGGHHQRGRIRRGFPHRHELRALPLRPVDRAALLLHAVLGLRHRRAVGPQRRDGAAHGLPDPFPADLRLVGLRAGEPACRVGSRPSPSTSR